MVATGLRNGPANRNAADYSNTPYVIFYTPITDGIEVQRIVHGARDLEGLI